MKKETRTFFATMVLLVLLAAVLTGCAAGDPRFTDGEPAGFWYGLWHGFIIVVTFVISLFSDQTVIYEAHNTGGWYDFGFLLGVLCMGGGCLSPWKKGRKARKDREWEELGRKVEQKVMREVGKWVDAKDPDGKPPAGGDPETKTKCDEEWEETGRLVEQKIKRKLRKWAEED